MRVAMTTVLVASLLTVQHGCMPLIQASRLTTLQTHQLIDINSVVILWMKRHSSFDDVAPVYRNHVVVSTVLWCVTYYELCSFILSRSQQYFVTADPSHMTAKTFITRNICILQHLSLDLGQSRCWWISFKRSQFHWYSGELQLNITVLNDPVWV